MSKKVTIPIEFDDANFIPTYSHPDDAGCDVKAITAYNLSPQRITIVETGIKINVPKGYVVDVRTKSGQAVNGIFVINSPGTIDPFYTGSIKVLLFNTTTHYIKINKGDKIAQLVCHKFNKIAWLPVCDDALEESAKGKRGDNGFGSTGR